MKTNTVSAFALACSLFLTACGAEREEPFNPPEDDGDDEIRDPVTVSRIERFEFSDFGVQPPYNDEPTGKRLEIATNVDDFNMLVGLYAEFVDAPDFSENVVLLYDSGWTDESVCEQQLLLDEVDAFRITEEDDEAIVEVVLTYDRQIADDSAVCEEELEYREVAFYSINTTSDIIFVEEVEGLNDDNRSSSSRRSSSSSSSSSM